MSAISLSAIVFWEIAKLHPQGRITLCLEDRDLMQLLEQVYLWPPTREVSLKLSELDFASDTADELIAAASCVHRVKRLTPGRSRWPN